MSQKHSHYKKDVSHLSMVDVYRVLSLFNVTDPAIQHAIKKLLVAGGRGSKDQVKDYNEAIDSVQRALDMLNEDGGSNVGSQLNVPSELEFINAQLSMKVRDLTQENSRLKERNDIVIGTKEGDLVLSEQDVTRMLKHSGAKVRAQGTVRQSLTLPRKNKAAPVRRSKRK